VSVCIIPECSGQLRALHSPADPQNAFQKIESNLKGSLAGKSRKSNLYYLIARAARSTTAIFKTPRGKIFPVGKVFS